MSKRNSSHPELGPAERQLLGLSRRPEAAVRKASVCCPELRCRWTGCSVKPNNPASLREHLTTHIPRIPTQFPFNCEWECCDQPLSCQEEGIDHLIRCHLGYDGNLDTLPVRKMKSFRPPPPLVGKPCLWHGCDYRVVKVCALNLAKHAVSTHVNGRSAQNLSRACEWEGCGEIFITARQLADHLTITHAKFMGAQIVCYCGELVGKPAIKTHENSCPVRNNLPIPPPTTPTIKSEDPSTRAQKRGHGEAEGSPQPAANEPRKTKSRRTTSFIDLSHSDTPVEIESSAVLPDESTDDDGPPMDANPSRGTPNKVFLKTLEQQRVQQQKMDEDMMRKRTEERGRRRLEHKQQKEQQQEPKTHDLHPSPHPDQHHQEVTKMQDPSLALYAGPPRGQLYQETPKPRALHQTKPLDNVVQSSTEPLVDLHGQPESKEAATQLEPHRQEPNQSTYPEPYPDLTDPPNDLPAETPQLEDRLVATHDQEEAVARLTAFADKLQNLSNTIRKAVNALPVSYIEGLDYELDNDWATDEMETMVEGVIKVYGYGGKKGWKTGNKHPKWSNSVRQQHE